MTAREHTQDQPYTDDRIAYEVWVWKANRSAKETARILAEVGLGHITREQIQRWSQSRRWAARADNDIKQLAPSIHNETVGGLIIAGLKAQRAVDQMLEDWIERRIEPNNNTIKLVDVALKYAGMSPMGTRDPTETIRTPIGAASTIVQRYLTPDEIAHYLEQDDTPASIPELTGGNHDN